MFLSDLRRAFSQPRWLVLMLLCALTLYADMDDAGERFLQAFTGGGRFSNGAVDAYIFAMRDDRYKIVLQVLLMSFFTASSCSDRKTHFIRMALARGSLKRYVISKFAVNTIVIVTAYVSAVFLFALFFVGLGYPFLQTINIEQMETYYQHLILSSPGLFLLMAGLVFGMVSAAFGSFGLLFSAYRSNTFVTVCIGAMLYYLTISYQPFGSVFGVWKTIAMDCTLPGDQVPYTVMFSWSILWPVCVILLCMMIFYRKMKWRLENGDI